MKSIHNKLKNNTGATILMALALMAVAVVVSFIVVTTATTSSKIVLPDREISLSDGLTLSCRDVNVDYSGITNYGSIVVTVDGKNVGDGSSAGVLLQYRTSGSSGWSTTAPSQKDVGSITVQVKAMLEGYKTAYSNYSITVNPIDALVVTATTADNTYIYDGKSHKVKISVSTKDGVPVTNADIWYRTSIDKEWSQTVSSRTNAGSSTVYVKVCYDNYVTKEVKFKKILVVNKRSLTLIGDSGTKEYNAQVQTLDTYTLSGTLAENQTASISYKASGTDVNEYDGVFSNIKIYTKKGTDATANYDIKTTPGKLTITPVTDTVTVTITGKSGNFNYDGASHTISGYTFSSDNSAYTETCCKFSGTKTLTRTDADTYDLGLKVADFTNISTTNFKNVKFVVYDGSMTINKRSASFDGETKEVSYTSSAQSITGITSNSLLSGHTFSGISYVATGTTPGTYTGQFSGTATIIDSNGKDVTANYSITYNPGTLKIKAASKENADSSIKLVRDQLKSELKTYKYDRTEYEYAYNYGIDTYGYYNDPGSKKRLAKEQKNNASEIYMSDYAPATVIDPTNSGIFSSYITEAINNYLDNSSDDIVFTVQPSKISGMTVPVTVTLSIKKGSGCSSDQLQATLEATYVDSNGQEKKATDTLTTKPIVSTSDGWSDDYVSESFYVLKQDKNNKNQWNITNETKKISWKPSYTTVTFYNN